jgi:hypothetical protein
MFATLVGVKLAGPGKVERDVVVTESISLFNLHRVFQFCLHSSFSDDGIAAVPFKFKYGKKVLKGPKGTQLYRVAGKISCEEGTTFAYETDKGAYTVKITGITTGDAQYYVPRCVSGSGGNVNLDATNKKLLRRRFTAAASSKKYKAFPSFWCDASTTDDELMRGMLSSMREPLHGWHPR